MTRAAAAAQAVAWAKEQGGKPYIFGGVGPEGFDCSGLVLKAYEEVGVNLPRTTEEQYTVAQIEKSSTREVGDLLFFRGAPSEASPGHVAIYLAPGETWQAPQTGELVGQYRYDEADVLYVTRPVDLLPPDPEPPAETETAAVETDAVGDAGPVNNDANEAVADAKAGKVQAMREELSQAKTHIANLETHLAELEALVK